MRGLSTSSSILFSRLLSLSRQIPAHGFTVHRNPWIGFRCFSGGVSGSSSDRRRGESTTALSSSLDGISLRQTSRLFVISRDNSFRDFDRCWIRLIARVSHISWILLGPSPFLENEILVCYIGSLRDTQWVTSPEFCPWHPLG